MLYCLKNFSKRNLAGDCIRRFHPQKRMHSGGLKVTIVGAAGRIGKPLSLMLKQSPLIDELALYDVRPTCDFALELGHIDTNCKVSAFTGPDGIVPAYQNAQIVVCVAQNPKAVGRSFNDTMDLNFGILKEVAYNFARNCPKALLAVSTQPINSLIPMVSEELKRFGRYNPSAVFGISTIHAVRANTFAANILELEPECVVVPIIGGNNGATIVPVLSQAKPCSEFTSEELVRITKALQNADDDMMKIKIIRGATLSAAFAIARFIISLVKGLRGYQHIIEYAYVLSTSKLQQTVKYLTTPIQLGPNGVMKNFGLPQLTDYEKCLFENAVQILEEQIKAGQLLAGIEEPPPCDPCNPDIRAPPCPPDWCEIKYSQKKFST